jgi:hypothetical protein
VLELEIPIPKAKVPLSRWTAGPTPQSEKPHVGSRTPINEPFRPGCPRVAAFPARYLYSRLAFEEKTDKGRERRTSRDTWVIRRPEDGLAFDGIGRGGGESGTSWRIERPGQPSNGEWVAATFEPASAQSSRRFLARITIGRSRPPRSCRQQRPPFGDRCRRGSSLLVPEGWG